MTRSHAPNCAPYLKALIYTAIFSGLRLGELRALTWDHINFKDEIIQVRQAADDLGVICKPKTKAGIRDVTIMPQLLKVAREEGLMARVHHRQVQEDLLHGPVSSVAG